MRWGVRRSKGGVEKGKSGSKGDSDKPKVVVGKTKTEGKSAATMSDVQLRKVNNRLQMEKQYKDLTRVPPGKLAKAESFVLGIAANVARQQITNLANEAASKQIAGLMGKGGIPKPPILDSKRLKGPPARLLIPPVTPRLG